MADQPLIVRARDTLSKEYAEKGAPFVITTKNAHSTATLSATVTGANTGQGFGYAVFAPQTVDFFSYGIGDSMRLGALDVRATEVETNLNNARKSPNNGDLAIEAIGFQSKNCEAQYTSGNFANFGTPTDQNVQAALLGGGVVVDPFGVVTPPICQSPLALENAIFSALAPQLAAELQWNNGLKTEKMGTLDLMPQYGASSYLRANGVPSVENRHRIPEGFIWRREGAIKDNDLIIRASLLRPVVVPFQLPTAWDGTTKVAPVALHIVLSCRIGGLLFSYPSSN